MITLDVTFSEQNGRLSSSTIKDVVVESTSVNTTSDVVFVTTDEKVLSSVAKVTVDPIFSLFVVSGKLFSVVMPISSLFCCSKTRFSKKTGELTIVPIADSVIPIPMKNKTLFVLRFISVI